MTVPKPWSTAIIARRRARGMSLIEMAVYVSVVGVILGTATFMVVLILDGSHAVSGCAVALSRMERFRAAMQRDVTRAESFLPEVGELKAGAELLLLKMPDGTVRGWGPDARGKGVGSFEVVDGECSERTSVLRNAKAEFRVQELDGRPVGVIVEARLEGPCKWDKTMGAPSVCFSVFREAL